MFQFWNLFQIRDIKAKTGINIVLEKQKYYSIPVNESANMEVCLK